MPQLEPAAHSDVTQDGLAVPSTEHSGSPGREGELWLPLLAAGKATELSSGSKATTQLLPTSPGLLSTRGARSSLDRKH